MERNRLKELIVEHKARFLPCKGLIQREIQSVICQAHEKDYEEKQAVTKVTFRIKKYPFFRSGSMC